MTDDTMVVRAIYDGFNNRNIDAVLALLTDDVVWANSMDGGHVHGVDAVRAYWTRQWTVVSPRVEPLGFHRRADGSILVEVRQTVQELQQPPTASRQHGLESRTVEHVFRLRDNRVFRFDIGGSG